MGYEKIDACVNDCCLFRHQLPELDNCPKCNSSQWKINTRTGEVKKGIPQKVLRYFPIILRLKRMFRSEEMAKDIRWHFTNKSTDGKMRHPVDSVTWDQMNEKYQSFAAEERNIRLGLSTNGFNPFHMKNVNYSAWPVLLVNYSMPPDKCMKEENIMFTLLIPGPTQPGNNIDVYLEPLIEDLNHLWEKGELTYDAFSNTTFTLRAMLLWTIQDFLAYGNLAGCKVKGKIGCPVCGKHTDSLWLSNCRKHVYMSHRKSLPPRHVYRGKKAWFDGKSERGRRSRILTGHNIYQIFKNYKNDFGNVRVTGRNRKMKDCVDSPSDTDDESEEEEEEVDEEELSRWKKRSILFKLPYWKEMSVRHNLDVMHVEINVAASLVATLKDLHPQVREKRTYLPPAPWSLSKTEKKVFCKRLFDFRGPDGYCSNISRCIKMEACTVKGLKSHDYRVLMQQLLLVAIRGLLPKGVRIAIGRLCAFFNHLCQRVIDRETISVIEHEIVETICMFERYMKVMKDFVRNTARPEGCIAEAYLAEECMRFYSDFLKKTINADEELDRNADYENCSILEGRPISAATSFPLTDNERNIAHLAVIHNMAFLDPYVEYVVLSRVSLIPINSDHHEDILKWLAYGPRHCARSYTGYIVIGNQFHTILVDRQTQNSDVLHEATTMCRASAKDNSPMVDVVSYYGRVVDIILLDYNVFYIPIFWCQWAKIGNGVKEEDGFTLVNLNQSQVSFAKDPYILASQGKQVFYSRVDESSSWYVAIRGSTRRYSVEDAESGNADVGPLPVSVNMDADDLVDEARNARSDCERIYV
ncbi:PREDICTED: uncharacterized protein LOC104734009 [Camelina sativa]|uniref:Uncharacterized protein LOC104734009 n=1 Tax=Camelina sativa TaxID=90675 RepID=A0ABM0V6V0_CAMSA|nr:PREDICTED: uncharacterized protein LOC104734009 [Camelina sativa]